MSLQELFKMDSINVIVPLKYIQSNPFRNFNQNVYDQAKLETLSNSIGEHGFWNNIMGRPADNKIPGLEGPLTLEALLKYLEARDYVVDFYIQITFGHHRIKAIELFNEDLTNESFESIRMELKFFSDTQMIQIQAEENRDEWRHGMATKIESVDQALGLLEDQLKEFGLDEFAEYNKKYPTYFTESKAFKEAKGDKGVGPTYIAKFLGKGWDKKVIQGPLAAIKASRKGYFKIEDCYNIETPSSLTSVMKLVNAIWDSEDLLPDYFKPLWTKSLFEIINKSYANERPIPVSTLEDARKQFVQGYDPLLKLKNGFGGAFTAMGLFESEFRIRNIKDIDGIKEQKFLNDFELEKWSDEIQAALDSINGVLPKNIKPEDSKSSGEEGTKSSGEEGTKSSGEEDPNLTNLEDIPHSLDKPDTPPDFEELADSFIAQSNSFLEGVSKLKGSINKIPRDKGVFFARLEETISTLVALYKEVFGQERLMEIPNVAPESKVKAEMEKAIAESDPDVSPADLMAEVLAEDEDIKALEPEVKEPEAKSKVTKIDKAKKAKAKKAKAKKLQDKKAQAKKAEVKKAQAKK